MNYGSKFRRCGVHALFGLVTVWLVACAGCATTSNCSTAACKDEVLVMGMIHSGHRTNPQYGIDTIKAIVREIKPDYVLCEIPPDRLETALTEFRNTGRVAESRVSRFPEYVDALFPLSREMDFVIVPCAGWTKPMADARHVKLESYRTTRSADYEEMERAEAEADRRLHEEGLSDDPMGIHTDRYDAIVKEGLEPYNRLFNDDLGAGGWDNINRAHYALIERAIDRYGTGGKRFLIMFGSWHKYWIKEQLRRRKDILLRSVREFVPTRTTRPSES
ncbi:MAG: hypothetical protein ACE5E5_03545 [Phycisphaerae bacterium]